MAEELWKIDKEEIKGTKEEKEAVKKQIADDTAALVARQNPITPVTNEKEQKEVDEVFDESLGVHKLNELEVKSNPDKYKQNKDRGDE